MNTLFPKIKKMSPQLIVADLERSLDFYIRVLGFAVDFRYEDFYAGIIRDGFSIHLKSGKPGAEERATRLAEEHLNLMFSVADIGDLFEAMQNRPVTVIQPLRQMPYGREFYLADPDGYLLGFVEDKQA
jgi:catechol 2,3-dioxygenase-like lactoylglutathione lyase family enzyme